MRKKILFFFFGDSNDDTSTAIELDEMRCGLSFWMLPSFKLVLFLKNLQNAMFVLKTGTQSAQWTQRATAFKRNPPVVFGTTVPSECSSTGSSAGQQPQLHKVPLLPEDEEKQSQQGGGGHSSSGLHQRGDEVGQSGDENQQHRHERQDDVD